MKKLSFFLATLLLIAFSFDTKAQDGANDPTFNPTDIGFGFGDGPNEKVYATAIQSDDKIIIGGQFTSYNGTNRNYVARLNTNGTLDATFNTGAGANNYILATAIQGNGKIIIGGQFTSYNGTSRNYIARLNTDGTLDAAFDPGTGANFYVQTILIQSDGKIIIGGQFTSYNGTARNRIARLNADGTLDATFNAGTGANNIIYTTAIQSDGKIIIGGSFTSYNGTTINRIARLNTDGTLDATFNPGAGVNNIVYTTAIQSDGKIIIGGDFTLYNGATIKRIVRINSDGTLDATFNTGTGAGVAIYAVVIQSDGKVIIGGGFYNYNGTSKKFIARLNTDGTLDATFNIGGSGPDGGRLLAIAIQSDGKIIIGGVFSVYNQTDRNFIAHLNADGTLDAAFNPGTGANNYIKTTSIQSDGKIIIGGYFTLYNGCMINRIARLNADGTLDATLNPGTGAGSIVLATAIQSDGKIIIGGNFTLYNGITKNHIARLNTDGSLDATFNIGTGADADIYSIAIQSDGKIIIGGWFSSYNGTTRNCIARLNIDGTLDATFNPGTGANDQIITTIIQSDGKIIIGGRFTSYNGTSSKYIARLNNDGTRDATFNVGLGANNYVQAIAIQSDGKIIISGSFTSYNGTARTRIARLNTDGTIDATFNPGTGADSDINTTTIQSDGKIIIGGTFTSYNGMGRSRIARLNANGTLDATFNPGTGTSNSTLTTAIQSDGKIIIGGYFTSYNGTGRNRIARILNTIPVEISSLQPKSAIYIYPNPASSQLTIETKIIDNCQLSISNINGQELIKQDITTTKTQIDISGLVSGVYFVKVVSDKGVEVGKFVRN